MRLTNVEFITLSNILDAHKLMPVCYLQGFVYGLQLHKQQDLNPLKLTVAIPKKTKINPSDKKQMDEILLLMYGQAEDVMHSGQFTHQYWTGRKNRPYDTPPFTLVSHWSRGYLDAAMLLGDPFADLIEQIGTPMLMLEQLLHESLDKTRRVQLLNEGMSLYNALPCAVTAIHDVARGHFFEAPSMDDAPDSTQQPIYH